MFSFFLPSAQRSDEFCNQKKERGGQLAIVLFEQTWPVL